MRRWLSHPSLGLALLVAASPAAGQIREPGDIGVFFDSAATMTTLEGVAALDTFDVFVMTYSVPGGIEAYEFELWGPLPSHVVVSGGRELPPGAFDFGQGDDNWIVGTGGICHGREGLFIAVAYRGVMFLSDPGSEWPFCLMGSDPTSFPNGRPGYLVCNSPGVLRNFGLAYYGCATVNPCPGCYPIPGSVSTFGGLKARFDH